MKYRFMKISGESIVINTFHDDINSDIIHASLDLLCKISIKPSRRLCTFNILIIFNN